MSAPELDIQNGSLGYERLRDVALDGREVSRARWGLSLFMNRGFLVWITTWIKIEETSPSARVDERTDATDLWEEIALPDAVQGRMVAVLAGMVLGALREEVA